MTFNDWAQVLGGPLSNCQTLHSSVKFSFHLNLTNFTEDPKREKKNPMTHVTNLLLINQLQITIQVHIFLG